MDLLGVAPCLMVLLGFSVSFLLEDEMIACSLDDGLLINALRLDDIGVV